MLPECIHSSLNTLLSEPSVKTEPAALVLKLKQQIKMNGPAGAQTYSHPHAMR